MGAFYLEHINVLVALSIFFVCNLEYVVAVDKVRIRDVEVLTLYKGRMTTGRRSSPVPQLKCVGGSAGCSAFVPRTVQCYNRGWDGYDAQWECKTDMDNKYRFGHIQVNCEGYDYPDDPYILRGSCGLEYTIELTEEGYARQESSYSYSWNGYQNTNRKRWKPWTGVGDLIMLVFVGVIFYMLYSTCTARRHIDADAAHSPYPEDPNEERRRGPSAPPPYSPDPPGFKREYTQGCSGSPPSGASQTSSPGFWTGALTGGLLGYLFGGRSSTYDYYSTPYSRPGYGGWGSSYSTPYYDNGGSWFGGSRSYAHRPSYRSYGFSSFGSSSSSSSSSSSGSRTSSGMGGTSRR